MDQDINSNKQRLSLRGLTKACAEYDHTPNWVQHFDEAVHIQSEIDSYSKFKHTYSEETCSDLQVHILDVVHEAGWQFHVFFQNHFGSKSNTRRI